MAKEIKTIGVLTSGGDAPGMNAAIRAVVRSGLSKSAQEILPKGTAENIQSIRDQAKYLQQEAKEIINNAKQKIEQMILGK